jgi:hypothetical protein
VGPTCQLHHQPSAVTPHWKLPSRNNSGEISSFPSIPTQFHPPPQLFKPPRSPLIFPFLSAADCATRLLWFLIGGPQLQRRSSMIPATLGNHAASFWSPYIFLALAHPADMFLHSIAFTFEKGHHLLKLPTAGAL